MASRRRRQAGAGRGTAGGAPASAPGLPPRAAPAARPRSRREAGWLPPLEPDAGGAPARGVAWALAAVIGLGAVLRAAHLVWLRETPFFSGLMLDARAYDEWAQQIAAGAWIGTSAFWVDPLYAYVLGAIYRVAGHDLLLPRLLNAVLGVATAVVVASTARRVWGSRLAALAAALLVVLFVPAIHFEGQIEKTALTVFLLALGVELFLIGSSGALAAAGAVVGLATLARGNMLLFVPLAALVLALGWDRERGDPLVATARQRRRRAALLLGGALPVIALATLHNYLAAGEFVPTTTNLGINLYLGNHPGNLYGYYDAPSFLTPSTHTEVPDFRAEAERRSGRRLGDRELSSYWTGETLAALRADPGLAVTRVLRKLRLSLHDDEVPDSEAVELVGLWSPVVRVPLVWFGQLLAIGVLGAAVGWRRRGVRVLAATAALYVVSLLPFFIMARLRVQVLPPLAVLGGGAVAWIGALVAARRWRPLAVAAGIVAAVALVAYPRPDWMAKRRTGSLAVGWHNLGATLADLGRPEDAVRAYERAVQIDARAVPAALRALGRYYQSQGDFVRAEAAMQRVVELRPQSPSAREALRGLYDAMLRDARWRDDARVRARRQALGGGAAAPAVAAAAPTAAPAFDPRAVMNRARAALREGRPDEAVAILQTAVREGPYDEGLHYMLGQAMERHASPAAMVEFFSAEVGRDEKPQTSHYFWAIGLARQGDVDGAVAHFQQALEIDPAHEMSQHRWGLLLEAQGRLDEALTHLAEATRIHPEFPLALQDAARVAETLGRTAEAQEYRARAAGADPNSPRRYLYWARYLHGKGRHAPALAEINHLLAERPTDAEALALRTQIRAALGQPDTDAPPVALAVADPAAGAPAGPLAADRRAALVSALAGQPQGTPAWIAFDDRYPAAEALARQIAAAFGAAGWRVQRIAPVGFPVRGGIFFFAADDPPSAAASAASAALSAARLEATVGTGYRAFVEERRRADPSWRGFDLAPGQDFVIVVGRQEG